jgi:hypothetical protein
MTTSKDPDEPLTYETPAEANPIPTDEEPGEVTPPPPESETPEEATPASPTSE